MNFDFDFELLNRPINVMDKLLKRPLKVIDKCWNIQWTNTKLDQTNQIFDS